MTPLPPLVTSLSAEDYDPYDPGEVHWLRKEDKTDAFLWSGIWRVRPDQLSPRTYHESQHDETFLLIEGELLIELVDGPTLDLRAGDIASVRRGTRALWTVLQPTREFFVYT